MPAKLPTELTDPKTVVRREGETVAEAQARARRFRERFKALQGKIKLNIDLDELRGRRRH